MRKVLVGLLALVVLAGCSSNQNKPVGSEQKPQEKKEAPKAAELQTGRAVLQKLYISARGWAPDTKPFRLESQVLKDSTGHDGKAPVWRGYFASVTRRSMKPFLWSGITTDDGLTAGVSPGGDDTYNPNNSSTQTFDINFLKIDSDKAFEVAQSHGGAALLKKTPDQPVIYSLDWIPSKNALVWHVMYGDSRSDSKLSIAVDATSGAFIRKE